MKQVRATTSWDDGHVLDLRLAALLKQYRLAGTFYIAPRDREVPTGERLTDDEIRELSADFEIGAHSMTHPKLTELTDEDARKEIIGSKEYLEKVIGKEVQSFCYPAGFYGSRDKQIVKEAGFRLARTVKRFSTHLNDSFELATTVHAYRHWSDALSILKAVGVKNFLKAYLNWDVLAIHLFNKTAKEGGIFHLWGHSWEIDKNKDWDRLEKVLAHISGHPDITCVDNIGLIATPSKKTVVFVTPYFPPHGGGLEKYAYEIASRLQKDFDWHVEVITSGEKGIDVVEEYKGLRVHRLAYQFKISNTPFSFRWFKKVRAIIEDIEPTILNVHMPVPGIGDVAIWVAGSRYPVVLTYHAGTMRKEKMLPDIFIWLYEHLIFPMLVKRVDHIVCSSAFVKRTVFPKSALPTTLIPPGVDLTFFRPQPDIVQHKDEIVFICSFASMHRIKGLNVLVKAVDIVAKRFPEVSVKVIGEKGHTTSSRIHFIGPQRGDDLLREISSGSLLALCSLAHTESYPMVLLEAMACRKPVIGTNAGGVPEIITDNVDGLITLSGDEQALAVAIEKILGDEKFANRLAEAGYQKVNERSGWDRKVSQTQEVFSEVSR